ncbi:hypothetical protein BC828DRAFT_382094 [Blastocladiella britannica]|nr:hypothetical protein BC828DRAFT_382094 [Blastocladiella britannica]
MDKEKDCPLAEIIQYRCDLRADEVVCVPFVRLFRRCPGKPAVEITPAYDALGHPISPPLLTPPEPLVAGGGGSLHHRRESLGKAPPS